MSDSREPAAESTEDEDEDDGAAQIQQQQQQQPMKMKMKKKKKKEEEGGERRRARNLVMIPLRKFERVLSLRKKSRASAAPFPYSEDLGRGCRLCAARPAVRTPDSPTSRQNPDAKANSYHGFLRNLLESNDFYSAECNVHRDC